MYLSSYLPLCPCFSTNNWLHQHNSNELGPGIKWVIIKSVLKDATEAVLKAIFSMIADLLCCIRPQSAQALLHCYPMPLDNNGVLNVISINVTSRARAGHSLATPHDSRKA